MSEQPPATGPRDAHAAAPAVAVRAGASAGRLASPPRRRALKVGAGVAALGGAAAAGYLAYRPADDRQLVYARVSDAMAEVDRLQAASPRPLGAAAAWTWTQTLVHCAQSIEFSMQGFPEAKSPLFQRTAGAAAFNIFAWRGRMSHNLAEPIPGAPPLSAQAADAAAAWARLHAAATAFAEHAGPLQPHFAYGALTRAEYEQAHAMHLANHLSAFDVHGPASGRLLSNA